ncbi:SIMPL domain-containing protein [Pseudidiomarina sp.]|uniref:SIMPL domain-containing protein n=1 Tax=Pseudidiomarina sp. TaxID=2081707 RepID=UPI003A97E12C
MRYLSSVILALGALTLIGCQPVTPNQSTHDDTLSVSTSASVQAVPDRVQLTVNVERTGMDIPAFKAEVDSITAGLIQQLKKQNVAETAIQSHALRVYPQHRYDEGEQKLVGYQVNRRLVVDFGSIDQHAEFLEFALNNGVQRVDEPVFSVSNAEELYQQALTEAIRLARSKAERMANAAGVSLQGVQSIQESSQQAPMVRYRVAQAAMSDSVSLPGQQSIEARVAIVYTLTEQ